MIMIIDELSICTVSYIPTGIYVKDLCTSKRTIREYFGHDNYDSQDLKLTESISKNTNRPMVLSTATSWVCIMPSGQIVRLKKL